VFADGTRRSAWTSPWIDAPIGVDAGILIAYAVARTIGGSVPEGIWWVAATLVAVRWPASGLGIAVVIALLPQQVRSGMTPDVALVAASAVGFAIGAASGRLPSASPGRAVWIVVAGAAALAAATFLALIHTQRAFDHALAVTSTLRWTESVAGLAILVLGLRSAALGSMRPLVLALAGVFLAMLIALVGQVAPTVIASSPFGWVLASADTGRAAGSFLSPNRLGTIAAVAVVVAAVNLVFGHGTRRWRAALFGGLASAALVLSFSRGALLGLAIAGGVLIAVRSRRRAAAYGLGILVAGFVLLPLLIGGRLAGSGGTLQVLLENDAGRVDAWLAGIRMILAKPLFGHGFNAFAVLGAQYGATDGLQTAHFELIDLWAQAGIAAAVGFVAIVLGMIGGAVERKADPWALAALGAIVVFVVASSFNVQSPFLAVMGPVWIVSTFGIACGADAAPAIAEPEKGGPPAQPDNRRLVT
jgi:O-antigen ligase